MPLFHWKKSYETGVDVIDEQHQQLVDIINDLSDAMMNQKGYIIVPRILDELVDYVQLHFTTEEKIMRETKYPALEEHCREHLGMTNKVIDLKRNYSENQVLSSVEVLKFLCDWLKEHIVASDMQLRAHIHT